MKDFAKAILAFEKCDLLGDDDPAKSKRFYDDLRSALREGGAEGYWRKRLELELEKTSPDLYYVATLYARLGEKDNAYENLAKAFQKNHFAGGLMVDVCWDRNDERFKALARRVGLMQ